VSESESKEDRKGMESRSDATTREGRRETYKLDKREERATATATSIHRSNSKIR
jgi:hypothetical protein